MLVKELLDFIMETLAPLYDKREARAIATLYLQDRLALQKHEIPLRYRDEVEPTVVEIVRDDLVLLSSGVPVQYVLGKEEFCGLDFKVTPDVLIPRPETEELVRLVVDECCGRNVTVWDVGTGSGCIAVSLARLLPSASVFATDVSDKALEIAAYNAGHNGVDVCFAVHDMLQKTSPFGNCKFDVIVSNPPYIPASDRKTMHVNVAENEPENALFVPDDDKFVFYKALSCIGVNFLNEGGKMFVETYNRFHGELRDVFSASGFGKVESLRDFSGKDRFMRTSL